MSNVAITPDASQWWQWDTGRTVTVAGGTMTECHFANRKQGSAYVQAVINGVARVPDELLQVAAPITAYGYIPDGAGGQTYVGQIFEVIARNIPADYTYTKTAQKTIRDAEQARDQAFAAVNHVHDVADQVVGFKNDAKASADAAKKSADSAEYQKGQAKQYADDAGVAFANAQSEAKMSSSHATESKNSAEKSEASATKAAQSASEASASASEAATSAQEAKDAAGNAASEVLAATKANADAAAKSATDAATAKAGAETAAGEAATSASAAADSASAAAKSADDAAASVGAINVIAPKTIAEGATAPSLSFSAGYGASCSENANYSVAIGNMAEVSEIGSIAIGSAAISSTAGAVAIGDNAKVNHHNSAAIASHSETAKENEVSVGNADYAGGEYTREITHVSTPTAPTSASTKKYTDDNDAKTLTEAKKYTDDNTTNALIGTVSGKLLHVDDAWPDKPLSLTIDGAYKQDGTPSPENPVPITVIENPVLKVTGRNLLDVHAGMPESDGNKSYDNTAKRIIKPGTYVVGLTSNNYCNASGVTNVHIGDGNVSFTSKYPGYGVAFGVDLIPGVTYTHSTHTKAFIQISFYMADGTWISYTDALTFTVPIDTTYSVVVCRSKDGSTDALIDNVYIVVKQTTYKPFTSAALPITLPAEHPYLAALPDGTHDEIVIDKGGNAELVARIGIDRDVREIETFTQGQYYNLKTTIKAFASPDASYSGGEMCSAIPSQNTSPTKEGIYRTWMGVYVIDTSGRTREEIQADIDKNAPLTIAVKIPETVYQLGKLTIPSLPETISNVWIDAELTTDMSMTYKQDVNVVIAGLTTQIAALKSTADESPGVTDPTIE